MSEESTQKNASDTGKDGSEEMVAASTDVAGPGVERGRPAGAPPAGGAGAAAACLMSG